MMKFLVAAALAGFGIVVAQDIRTPEECEAKGGDITLLYAPMPNTGGPYKGGPWIGETTIPYDWHCSFRADNRYFLQRGDAWR